MSVAVKINNSAEFRKYNEHLVTAEQLNQTEIEK